MPQSIESLWQFNLDLSLLLLLVIGLRWALKRSAKVYNAYWLWLVLPLAPLISTVALWLMPAVNDQAFLSPIIQQLQTVEFTQADTQLAPTQLTTTEVSDDSSPTTVIINLVSTIWLLGCLFFIARLGYQHYTLRKKLMSEAYQNPIDLDAKYPAMGVTEAGFSPAVYGFFKPRIYFPVGLKNQLDSEQLGLILRHEEQHIQQGHLWLNLAWDLLVCICWLNPLTYLARHLFRHDQELFCDSLVLKNSDRPRQRAYGHALISTVSATHSVSLLCSWKMFDQLEERIMNINTQHPNFKKTLVTGAAIISLCASSLYTLATAGEPKPAADAKSETSKIAKSINIIKIDTDDNKQTTIKVDGKTYRLENGKRAILENGNPRELTEAEQQRFTELLAKAEEYANASESDKRHVFDFENVHAFTFDHDGDFDFEELEVEMEKMKFDKIIPGIPDNPRMLAIIKSPELIDKHIELSIENALDGHTIQSALRDSEGSQDAAVKKARKKLEKAQQRIKESQKQLEKERKEARKLLEELEETSSRPV